MTKPHPTPPPLQPRRLDYAAMVAKGYAGSEFDAHLETAEYREGVGNLKAALGYYLGAVELEPENAVALRRAGEMAFRLGHLAASLDLLARAAAAGDGTAQLAFLLGRAAESLADWPAAMGWFDLSLQRNDRDAKAYYHRGLVHGRLGDLAAATDDLVKATLLVPQYQQAYYDLARLYTERSMADEAMQALRQVQASRRMVQKVRKDPAFEPLRQYPSFWALMSGKVTI
jgi:tetratricopeptide (TPR) repeat protein